VLASSTNIWPMYGACCLDSATDVWCLVPAAWILVQTRAVWHLGICEAIPRLCSAVSTPTTPILCNGKHKVQPVLVLVVGEITERIVPCTDKLKWIGNVPNLVDDLCYWLVVQGGAIGNGNGNGNGNLSVLVIGLVCSCRRRHCRRKVLLRPSIVQWICTFILRIGRRMRHSGRVCSQRTLQV
jgi:hypothetical protein